MAILARSLLQTGRLDSTHLNQTNRAFVFIDAAVHMSISSVRTARTRSALGLFLVTDEHDPWSLMHFRTRGGFGSLTGSISSS